VRRVQNEKQYGSECAEANDNIRCRKAGATDNGKPGERSYTKGYYAAYVLDFEGNNIECVYYQPWWLSVIQLAPLTLGGILLGCMAWYAGRAGWSL
jgi:hypothetical protein